MAEQTVVFAFSIGEVATYLVTGREATLAGLMIGADSSQQYYIRTTRADGVGMEAWVRVGDLAAIEVVDAAEDAPA